MNLPKIWDRFKHLFKKCSRCGSRSNITTVHQGTYYTNPKDNLATLCPSCHEENKAYWEEMWKEYYSGRL